MEEDGGVYLSHPPPSPPPNFQLAGKLLSVWYKWAFQPLWYHANHLYVLVQLAVPINMFVNMQLAVLYMQPLLTCNWQYHATSLTCNWQYHATFVNMQLSESCNLC